MREELEALREAYLGAEEKALKGEAKLFSENWEGDVYVGSRWNVATVLALVSAVTTAAGLAFAFATKGVVSEFNFLPFTFFELFPFFETTGLRFLKRQRKTHSFPFHLSLSCSQTFFSNSCGASSTTTATSWKNFY